MVDNQVFF